MKTQLTGGTKQGGYFTPRCPYVEWNCTFDALVRLSVDRAS